MAALRNMAPRLQKQHVLPVFQLVQRRYMSGQLAEFLHLRSSFPSVNNMWATPQSSLFRSFKTDGLSSNGRMSLLLRRKEMMKSLPIRAFRWFSGKRSNRNAQLRVQFSAHANEKANSSEEGEGIPGDKERVDRSKDSAAVLSNGDENRSEETNETRSEDEREEASSKEGNNFAFDLIKAEFKREFESRILPWQKIDVSLTDFPYFLSSNTRDLLVDCTASYLKQPEFSSYGVGLSSSNRRILLCGPSGSQIYQEKLVKALAKCLKASYLSLDSSVLSPQDFGDHDIASESELESEQEDEDDETEWMADDSDIDGSEEEPEESDGENEERYPVCAVFEVAGEGFKGNQIPEKGRVSSVSEQENLASSDCQYIFRKGNRVKYVGVGKSTEDKATSRLRKGQRGRIVSVPKGLSRKVGVNFGNCEKNVNNSKLGQSCENMRRSENLIDWCDLADLEPDNGPHAISSEEWVCVLEALAEVVSKPQPLVVFLPDLSRWFERAVVSTRRQEFLQRVEEKLDSLKGPSVLIAGRTKEEQVYFGNRPRLVTHNIKTTSKWMVQETLGLGHIYDLFVNVVKIYPPKDQSLAQDWKKQLEHDKESFAENQNHQQIRKILELHNMECTSLNEVNTRGVHLTDAKAEKIVGWARNHYLATCLTNPDTSNHKLSIPLESFERAMSILQSQESRRTTSGVRDIKAIAEDEYEKVLISAVIPPTEVGVSFENIGALEDVKTTLKELVMLPLQRPELFVRGSLAKPCRGVLLFGPPGTGKTLLAKAVATEAGANFINITSSSITSKWFGDAEKLIQALFRLARKLAPSVIFVDEVDSIMGARGGGLEHETTRRMRNEFLAAWDGLRSKDYERVLVLAATNRPFDLDDAVIRRLPRRILVDLPDAQKRADILRLILADENLEESFNFDKLASSTEGYSGSDLKNLSIAAAYRPLREYLSLEKEVKAQENVAQDGVNSKLAPNMMRCLKLEDFHKAMSEVTASTSFDAISMTELRRWNEQYGEGGSRTKRTFGFAI
ncbi:hypothetical protein O6H91_08G052900 [Diphasiastrum complanatum]|uniref:Uncharacterized protein n=2 Tax=Diphasiastrum complanatum TaxID=34168 RepID=A0ACC2CXK3_DIPCM|nr:hypothetical protein O6H91_08G052900 [Diphasiastrum complanatum]KAJ7546751.1 hypothetical protein O6H91_08G052900 [Diphasiastrum complanatum]